MATGDVKQVRVTSLQRFRKLTEDLQKECLQLAHDELGVQATALVKVMQTACPVSSDPRDKPGLLRQSIGWTYGQPPKTRASGAFRPTKNVTGLNVYAGSEEALYARWVEFGTAPHSTAKGAITRSGRRQGGVRQHPGATAKPFFWPSYRLMKKPMRSKVKRKLTAAIKER